ncbi:hypothetical protein BOX30_03065 [Leptospirillum ferriphilum]|uniref:Uncharacterized protein n=1 Tax=Leptospirillum ferriphilum TaxID=178606 RepID=A0A1V3SU71_9BACT|nr:hypothetical protein BOX24_11320 [Leptospirillum ferriphilum]OOH82448.1 hypothetical protein BOX30_03065 [Leptospirillum ferriphilum]
MTGTETQRSNACLTGSEHTGRTTGTTMETFPFSSFHPLISSPEAPGLLSHNRVTGSGRG